MASNFRTFTITQARMGEPLQFQPALGSQELDELVDAYVPGIASKSDKLSSVTLDFFTHATVDFSTGSLTRCYSVIVSPVFNNYDSFAFETSPSESQSSGFSPASSMTFADSGYGSISMTPPARTQGVSAGRVKKAAKKETKKAAEVRLPGFSIMTKDGVDVTSSAGRGTKTKEQREHAHLMRIMKACDACKKKKIRCDPSHRRPQIEMSRSSTSSTTPSSSSRSSSSRPNPSPPAPPNPPQQPLFSNAIDDFVLFPEDNTWNAEMDMALPEFDENLDLSHFNFDIGLNDYAPLPDNFTFDLNQPFVADQYGFDQWASAQGGDLTAHTRPHHSISSQDSGHLDNAFHQDALADDGSIANPPLAQSSSSPEVDWSVLVTGMNANASSPDMSASLNRRGRRALPRAELARNAAIQALVDRIPSSQTQSISPDGILSSFSSLGGSELFSSPEQVSSSTYDSFGNSPTESGNDHSQSQSPGAATGGSLEYWGLDSARALVAESMQALKSTGAAYQPILEELQRLRGVLETVKSGDTERTPILQQALVSDIEMLVSQLQVLLTRVKNMLRSTRGSKQRHNRLDPEFHPDHLEHLAGQTKRLVSSLCATINSLQTQSTGIGGLAATTNTSVLASGNVQLAGSPCSPPEPHPQDAGFYAPQASYVSGSASYSESRTLSDIVAPQDDKTITLDGENAREDAFASINGSGALSRTINANGPQFRLVTKPAVEHLDSFVDEQLDAAILSNRRTVQTRSQASQDQHQVDQVDEAIVTSDNSRTIPPSILRTSDIETQRLTTIVPDHLLQVTNSILPSQAPLVRAQNVGGSGSAICQDGSSSPGSIPGTILEHGAYGTVGQSTIISLGFVSTLAMLSSLVLLNYIGVTSFVLPLAAVLFALPRPALSTIVLITMAAAVIQGFPVSDLIASLQPLLTLAVLSVSLLKTSIFGSKASFGKVLSSSRNSLSTSLSTPKDSSLLSMFNYLSLGNLAVV